MALAARSASASERDVFIDNLLVRIHFIIEMIWWTGLAPWELRIGASSTLRVYRGGRFLMSEGPL